MNASNKFERNRRKGEWDWMWENGTANTCVCVDVCERDWGQQIKNDWMKKVRGERPRRKSAAKKEKEKWNFERRKKSTIFCQKDKLSSLQSTSCCAVLLAHTHTHTIFLHYLCVTIQSAIANAFGVSRMRRRTRSNHCFTYRDIDRDKSTYNAHTHTRARRASTHKSCVTEWVVAKVSRRMSDNNICQMNKVFLIFLIKIQALPLPQTQAHVACTVLHTDKVTQG